MLEITNTGIRRGDAWCHNQVVESEGGTLHPRMESCVLKSLDSDVDTKDDSGARSIEGGGSIRT